MCVSQGVRAGDARELWPESLYQTWQRRLRQVHERNERQPSPSVLEYSPLCRRSPTVQRERGIAIVAHECVHVQMYIADMYVCRTY